jgi:hypothetical protein
MTEEYYFNYIVNEEELKDDIIFKSFDINYINLNILPYIYYPIFNKDYYKKITDIDFTDSKIDAANKSILEKLNIEIKNEIETVVKNMKNSKLVYNRYLITETVVKNMKNSKLVYNRYLITPITIVIVIIWIFLLLFLLKYIHYNYNLLYIYIISTIIILLLIFGSLWFLYVNSQLL